MPTLQQDRLQNVPLTSNVPTKVHGTDVEAFIIKTLDPETQSTIETLELKGTNRPFSPIITPVTQDIHKTYYPGNANRNPTVQVMGGMEENVTLEGVFEARRLSENNREEPMHIVDILNRITTEGHLCYFQIGPWIRYGFIEQFTPSFKMKSMYQWRLDLMIVSRVNPLQKRKSADIEENNKIFGETKLSDLRDIRATIEADIEAAKTELEETNYLPIIKQDVFNIPSWLTSLRSIGPVGRVADIGSVIYDYVIDAAQIANTILDSVDNFVNQVDQISKETTKFILTIENLRSRLFRQSTNLYNSYSRISSSLDTAVRLSSLNPISAVGGVYFDMSVLTKDLADTARDSQDELVVRTHVVKVSDTLQTISTRYYGNWERWIDVRNANNLETSDLTENQILVIPE